VIVRARGGRCPDRESGAVAVVAAELVVALVGVAALAVGAGALHSGLIRRRGHCVA
jgi:hypothetical protein